MIATIPAGVGGLSDFVGASDRVAPGVGLSGPSSLMFAFVGSLVMPRCGQAKKITTAMADTPIAAAPIYLAGLARFTFAVKAGCSPLVRRPAGTPIAGLAR